MQSQQQSAQSMYWQPPSSSSQAPPPPGYGGGLGFGGPSNAGFASAAPFGGMGLNGGPGSGYGHAFRGNHNPSPSTIAPSRPPVRIEQPKELKQQPQPIRPPPAPASTTPQIPSTLPPANAAITFGKTGSVATMNATSGSPWKTAVSAPIPVPVKKQPIKELQQPSAMSTTTTMSSVPSTPSAQAPVMSALQVNQYIKVVSPTTAATPQKVIQLRDIRSNRKSEGGAVVEKSFADFDDDEVENKQVKAPQHSRNGIVDAF